MAKINTTWVKDQFAKGKVRVGVGMAVLKMLECWEEINLKGKEAEEALSILSKVALGHSLVPETKDSWVQAQAGFIKVGETVRVRHDAFDGELGMIHNGREGLVVALRSGDVIFKSTDDLEPLLDGAHYRPNKLEKLVRNIA
jgi:hypothetical protein